MRAAYAARLAGIGYIDEGLRQIDVAWNADPLNLESIVLRGWLTDVKGRHEEARPLLEMTPIELNLNRHWFNAVWRHDFAAARDLAARMPAQDKFTDSHVAASEALLNPQRWPQVQPRVAGTFASLVQPDADREASMRTIEALWIRQASPLPLVLWVPELAHVRSSAAFQTFLQRQHILDYWRSRGFPPSAGPTEMARVAIESRRFFPTCDNAPLDCRTSALPRDLDLSFDAGYMTVARRERFSTTLLVTRPNHGRLRQRTVESARSAR